MNQIKLEKEILEARRIEHEKVFETMFGDTVLTLMRNGNGELYVKLRRGMPLEKMYSLEHFCMLAQKFNILFQEIQKRTGGN